MKKIDVGQLSTNAEQAEKLLKILANRNRLMLLCHLVDGERTAGELEELVGLSQSALSQHLGRLRKEGIIKNRREAQRLYYSLKDEKAKQILVTMYELYCSPKYSGRI